MILLFFFFNDPATTEIYTLSLHDALPIFQPGHRRDDRDLGPEESMPARHGDRGSTTRTPRSEEHTSELQSRQYLVCRLLLEKKKNTVCKLHDRLFEHRLSRHECTGRSS